MPSHKSLTINIPDQIGQDSNYAFALQLHCKCETRLIDMTKIVSPTYTDPAIENETQSHSGPDVSSI